MKPITKITKPVVRKLLGIIDQGLSNGLGNPKPGQMCVEAAVCFALGLPHGDDPKCVGSAVRSFKIRLNDSRWSSNAARAKGMRKLAVAQLGSDKIDQKAFAKLLAEKTIRQIVPVALRLAAKRNQKFAEELEAAAHRCEADGTRDAALQARDVARKVRAAAYAAADAAYAAYAADAAYADAATAYADAAADATAAAYADYAADAAADYAADAAASATAYASATAAAYADYAADAAADYAADAAADYAADAAASADADAAAYADYAADADADATANAYASATAAATAADAAAADAAARDKVLTLSAECGLEALIELKSPGCKFLSLCE